MQVVLSTEAATGMKAGVYHLLADDETQSLCGAVQENSLFGGSPSAVLAREEAERQGFDLCKRCRRAATDGDESDSQCTDSIGFPTELG